MPPYIDGEYIAHHASPAPTAQPEPRRVSHEFCAEDRERIDKLMAAVSELVFQVRCLTAAMSETHGA